MKTNNFNWSTQNVHQMQTTLELQKRSTFVAKTYLEAAFQSKIIDNKDQSLNSADIVAHDEAKT